MARRESFLQWLGLLAAALAGEIADLRISPIVRHTADFEPEKTAITRDEHTLYLMDDL